MKLALYSDLHLKPDVPLELPVMDVDVVILAGDIARHTRGLHWATRFRRWPRQPAVLYVAGNHELYDAHLGIQAELSAPVWAERGIHVLEQQSLELGETRFLGCTLWSGFDLYGPDPAHLSMQLAQQTIADYKRIRARGGLLLTPADTRRMHHTAAGWLEDALAKPWKGKTVVVSHFAPHPGCVASKYAGDALTPYFVSDLSHLMRRHRIDLWAHGHTHLSTDFIAEGGCRVVSNQHGYASEAASGTSGFRPDLVIEI